MGTRNKLNNISPELENAYQICLGRALDHYENFPVASFLLPRYLRRSIAAIYAFARTADDIADEGDFSRDVRLEQMTKFEANLYDMQFGKPSNDPLFIALKHTIEIFNLPIQLFYDLLTAFRQDILKNRYQNFSEVLDYCHYSANPIGRLLLHLSGQSSPENCALSDYICTGLQLINFMQDIEIDLKTKDRCYIPMDEMKEYHLSIDDILNRTRMHNYRALINMHLSRAQEIYSKGQKLSNNLPGFFGFEIRYIMACGQRILGKLKKRQDLYRRPTITKFDLCLLFVVTILTRPAAPHSIDPIMEKL